MPKWWDCWKAEMEIDGLIAGLKNDETKESSFKALVKLGDVAVGPLITALKNLKTWNSSIEILVKLGDVAVGPLIVALNNKDPKIRNGVAKALGLLGDARAVEPLIAALGDINVRRAAAVALGQLGDARAMEPLIAALGDNDLFFSADSACALGQLGDARAVEALIAAFKNKHSQQAAHALGQLGDARAVEPLIAALMSGFSTVRLRAIFALGQLGDSRAVEPLTAVLRNASYLCEQDDAVKALRQLGVRRAKPELNKATTRSEAIKNIIILKAGSRPHDEMWYIQQVLPAVGLSLAGLSGTHIDVQYVGGDNLNQAYVMGFLMESGHDVDKCTLTPFNDRDGGSGMVVKVFA